MVLLQDVLSTLSISSFLAITLSLLPFYILITLYITFFTSYWWLMITYFIWSYFIDVKTPEEGGRSWNYLKNSKYIKYIRNYFPTTITNSENFHLDCKKNYLFISSPHGIYAVGSLITFGRTFCATKKLYPNHTSFVIVLSTLFKLPLIRESLLMFGMCSSSLKSILYLLKKPSGGNLVCLVVGGVEEMFYANPGKYISVLKKRKGFVKIALKTGVCLVPVIVFGENDLFDKQIESDFFVRIQRIIKNLTGLLPIVPIGRYYLPFLPKRNPINVVVGPPLDVQQIDNPSDKEIDQLHNTFIKKLQELFEKNKHKYVDKYEHTFLEII